MSKSRTLGENSAVKGGVGEKPLAHPSEKKKAIVKMAIAKKKRKNPSMRATTKPREGWQAPDDQESETA